MSVEQCCSTTNTCIILAQVGSRQQLRANPLVVSVIYELSLQRCDFRTGSYGGPLSIVVGVIGLTDVCLRVLTYLVHVKKASGSIQEEIDGLQRELISPQAVNEALDATISSAPEHSIRTRPAYTKQVQNLCCDVERIREECKEAVENLGRLLERNFEPLIKRIVGKSETKVTSSFDGLKKQLRRQAISEDLSQIRLLLANYQGRLQVLLTALNICVSHELVAVDYS